jgi:hypothetical protein
MSEIIAYCGLDCAQCNAFKATQAKDASWKEQLAKKWTEGLKVEFRPEDIECDGCMSNRISGWCQKICKIRPCAEERKVRTCAHCNHYPCEKLKEFLLNEPVATENLGKIRKTIQV